MTPPCRVRNDCGDEVALKVKKADQSKRTRSALMHAGRTLFASQGYAGTSTQSIVQRAEVTRGALYYHFQDKAGLFQAIFDELRISGLQSIQERIQTAEGDLWHRLVKEGLRAFLEVVSDPGMQRILYIDGPAVLPARRWHENVPAIATIQASLEQLAMAGFLEKQPFGTLARLFWGAFLEAALRLAHADDPEATKQEMLLGLEQLIAGLRIKHE